MAFYRELATQPFADRANAEGAPFPAIGYARIGHIEHYLQNYGAAVEARQQAVTLVREALARNPADRSVRGALAEACYELGRSLVPLARFQEAQEAYDQAMTVTEQLVREDPGAQHYQFSIARLQAAQAVVLVQTGELRRARQVGQVAREALLTFRSDTLTEKITDRLLREERIRCGYWLAKAAMYAGDQPGLGRGKLCIWQRVRAAQ